MGPLFWHTVLSSQIFLKSSNYSFEPFGGLIWISICLCFGCADICQAKQVRQGYERIIWEVFRRSGYFSTYGITVSMSCIWNIYNTSWLSIIMKQFHYYYHDIYKWTINQNIQLKAKMFPQNFFPLFKNGVCKQNAHACIIEYNRLLDYLFFLFTVYKNNHFELVFKIFHSFE